MKSQLEQLKSMTKVVADTGEIGLISQFLPEDATTNPSLILAAAKKPEYRHLIEEALSFASQKTSKREDHLHYAMNKVLMNFGKEILSIIPGRVSIEVDARFSYDTKKTVALAQEIIDLFEKEKIPRDRILIKLAATFEGIEAARELESKSIHCNMTLIFHLTQAIGSALNKATLISPFVGRILDWYKKSFQRDYLPHEDPGVLSVLLIYNYYKKFGHKTQVMGASFRSKEEILELAGCDLLTISPKLLEELQNTTTSIEKKLDPSLAHMLPLSPISFTKETFLGNNPMAKEKLSEGIENFIADTVKLENILQNFSSL